MREKKNTTECVSPDRAAKSKESPISERNWTLFPTRYILAYSHKYRAGNELTKVTFYYNVDIYRTGI